jgi:putative hydrolase of the HAD superfamily
VIQAVTKAVTTVLLDLDETILLDDAATDVAFEATSRHAEEVAGVDPERLIGEVRRISAEIWEAGPFPEWLDGIGTSEIEGLRARFEGADPHWGTMREWGPGFRFASWQRALAACDVHDDELARELDARFECERGRTNPFIAGADEALAELGSRFRLGIVTNGIPDVQRTKLVNADLTDRFGVIIVSGELGIGKPDPRIYQAALDGIGATAAETIMVGDNFRRDVTGAQETGIRGVWISIGRPSPDPSVEPFLVVETLADLPGLL